MRGLLDFTRMTGDLVKAMRALPAADRRRHRRRVRRRGRDDRDRLRPAARHPARRRSRSCSRASAWPAATWALRDAAAHHRPGTRRRAAVHGPLDERARRASAWGFFNRLVRARGAGRGGAGRSPAELAAGPNFAHAMTKKMLDQEWDMSVDAAIEAEAQAQAICMQTQDFQRAYRAFVRRKNRPEFEGGFAHVDTSPATTCRRATQWPEFASRCPNGTTRGAERGLGLLDRRSQPAWDERPCVRADETLDVRGAAARASRDRARAGRGHGPGARQSRAAARLQRPDS